MPHPPNREPASHAARAAAIVVAALAFLPIADRIPGGHATPWLGVAASTWLTGTLIALGAGVVLAIVSRRVPALWRPALLAPAADRWRDHPRAAAAATALAALAAYAAVAATVFDARPMFLDELAQMIQARIFAAGRVTGAPPAHPEFFSSMLVNDAGGRVWATSPPGHAALLALGDLLRASWLVVPVCAALSVAAFAALARAAEPRPGVAAAAVLLYAFAPMVLFMSGTHMNHPTALACILGGLAATAHARASRTPRPGLALLAGLAFGAAATIRPADALAWSLPAGLWLLAGAARDRGRWTELAASALGVALPVAGLLWFNARTTGHPLLFGYDAVWGVEHRLGFHEAPWGAPHSPARGLELLNLYFLRLQSYLFETPVPSLLPAVVALALAPRLRAPDRVLLAGAALHLTLYFAFWHDGFYLGPRYIYPLAPVAALWTARALPALRTRLGDSPAYRAAVYGALVAGAMAAAVLFPQRARIHAASLANVRWDADSAARAAGVDGALVLVRESWGSQVMARLWALGVPRTSAERLYRGTDLCALDSAAAALERAGARDSAALAALRPLLRDSALVRPSTVSPDPTERVLPGARYAPACLSRIADDRAGFMVLTPLLLARGDNIYARDLHARDTLLLREHPARPVFLLRPPSPDPRAAPRFEPLDRDSLWHAWTGRPRAAE